MAISGLMKSSLCAVRSEKRTFPNLPSIAAAMLPFTMLVRPGVRLCA